MSCSIVMHDTNSLLKKVAAGFSLRKEVKARRGEHDE